MEDSKKEKLKGAGVNLEAAMDRFVNNEELFMSFMMKFPEDENYGLLKNALEEKRYEDAFKAAHALKGLSGNLSLDVLYEVMCREVEFLRSHEYSEADGLFPEVTDKYEAIMKALEEM